MIETLSTVEAVGGGGVGVGAGGATRVSLPPPAPQHRKHACEEDSGSLVTLHIEISREHVTRPVWKP